MNAETLLVCGTDPYETKTILYTQWMMKGMQNGQREIYLIPRRSAGVAHAEKMGGLHIDITPGTDLLVVNAIARVIVENGWEDAEWSTMPGKAHRALGRAPGTRRGNGVPLGASSRPKALRTGRNGCCLRMSSFLKMRPRLPRSMSRRSTLQPNGWPSQKKMAPVQRPR